MRGPSPITLPPDVRPPLAGETIADSTLRRASDRLTAATGLTFPRSRLATLRRALAKAGADAGMTSVDSYLDELDRRPELLDRLISLVTIGETYFFRHPDQLELLSRQVIPALIDARSEDPDRVIRAWSAGCATGEEAYSLAILIHEVAATRPGWQFRVAGTDIDREALRRANRARYGRWSFRADLGPREAWFEWDDEVRHVRPSIREHVLFSGDNLSVDEGPPSALGGQADLILCRNVTIYLSAQARKRIAYRFLNALRPGGWLIVAPVEVSSSVYGAFQAFQFDGITAYRRPFDASEATRPTRVLPPQALPRGERVAASPPAKLIAHKRAAAGSPRTERPPPAPRRDPAARGLAASRLADLGRLTEARQEAELAIREQPRSGQAYRMLASIADAQGDLPASVAALRRAVYLDRTDVTAQFRLGLLEWRLGHQRPARARLKTALELVAGLPDAKTLEAGSDLTVGRLRNTIELLADG
ncbi:MAG TPA: CheR family methyltransferase [Patescibacteria group bacterium]|nr:CheR family methyltransferase [Patescibacteria group bacterium]